MFRKDKPKDTRTTKKINKDITSASGEKRIDFNVCPFSPYGRFGTWLKIIWRI